MIGKTLSNYRITGELGAGGMGAVYTAEHTLIGRRAAVKMLLPQFCNDKSVVERFFNEARAATKIQHRGIVDIFDFGYAEDGSAYIVMEMLDGESLTARLARGRLAEDDLVRLARQIAGALAAAHEAGIIHRDLKPDNIFIVPDSEVPGGERIKVLDFGIAKLTDDPHGPSGKTRTGAMMGSPLYMSPEQCRGAGEVDVRADIYSLGCVMYEMACGAPPFDGEGVGEVIAKHIYEEAQPPRARGAAISEGLEQIILTTLAKEPDQRFASMAGVTGALDAVSNGVYAHASRPVTAQSDAVTGPALAATGAPVHTTLGSATGAVSSVGQTAAPTAGRRGVLIGALGTLVVIGGVGIAVFGTGKGTGGDDSQPAPRPAAAAPAPAAPAAAPVTPDATPAKVELSLASTPTRALVRDADGKLLGETPWKQTVPKGTEPIELSLTAAGYEPSTVTLTPDQDVHRDVTLTAKPAEPARKRRSSRSSKRRDEAPKKTDDKYDPFD